MNDFKTLLIPWQDADAAPALRLAVALGKPFASHLVALHVGPDLSYAVPMGVEEMMPMAEAALADQNAAAQESFERACQEEGLPLVRTPPGPAGMSAQWVARVGHEEHWLVRHARFADLVVMMRPLGKAAPHRAAAFNAALTASGRPLLLAPPAALTLGQRIAVLWNDSIEAGRAVADALPLLQRAETVTVLTAREGRAAAPTIHGELAAYLAWHGVAAEFRKADTTGYPTGETLLLETERCQADLVVMGAYGHSRLRELVLGGVTNHVIQNAAIPVFLCH